MQKISPFLWFDDQAEEAANFYVSIFKNSAIRGVLRYGEGAPRPAGSAMSVTFVLDGLEFQALNGGPQFNELMTLAHPSANSLCIRRRLDILPALKDRVSALDHR